MWIIKKQQRKNINFSEKLLKLIFLWGNVLWDDGAVRTMGNLERPFILFDDDGQPTHMFFATSDGTKGFHDATKTWNMVIPLKHR